MLLSMIREVLRGTKIQSVYEAIKEKGKTVECVEQGSFLPILYHEFYSQAYSHDVSSLSFFFVVK